MTAAGTPKMRKKPLSYVISHRHSLCTLALDDSHNIQYIAHDPYVKERDYKETELTRDLNEAVSNADVLIFATNHKPYYNIDLDDIRNKVKKEKPIIIDGRNIFNKKSVEDHGFIYRKLGEGPKNYR